MSYLTAERRNNFHDFGTNLEHDLEHDVEEHISDFLEKKNIKKKEMTHPGDPQFPPPLQLALGRDEFPTSS